MDIDKLLKSKKIADMKKKSIAMMGVAVCLLAINGLGSNASAQQTDTTRYQIVEVDPEFPGGMEAMMKYLTENIKYPQVAKEQGIQGRVYVSFVVEKDGSVSNVRLLRDIGGGCGEEAVRVVGAMPKWKPGMMKGKAVRVMYNLPINFQYKSEEGEERGAKRKELPSKGEDVQRHRRPLVP